jgi:peptidoglycan/xylan/chitin deacetylase (PgdA/CDA1 family)
MKSNITKNTIITNATKKNGTLVISIDFELYWGVFDKLSLDNYRNNLIGSRKVIPKILDLFEKYDIHATWAIVGILFCKDKKELLSVMPKKIPKYDSPLISPYIHMKTIGINEKKDPLHYAPSLIKKISSYNFQEIGTHTFSHYCVLEKYSSSLFLEEELLAAQKIAKKFNLEIKSIVFPRNQYDTKSLVVCKKKGLIAYRGNYNSWLYKPRNEEDLNFAIRILRYVDTFINLAGHNAFDINHIKKETPVNIPASRFTYWYMRPLRFFEFLRIRRIKSDMRYAAKKGLVYHIWWHPHNFGVNMDENLVFLENILKEYNSLNQKYNMQSMNMSELAKIVLK